MERNVLKLLNDVDFSRLKKFEYSDINATLRLEFYEPNKGPEGVHYHLPSVFPELNDAGIVSDKPSTEEVQKNEYDEEELIDTKPLTVDDMDMLLIEDPIAYEMVVTGGTPHD